MKKLFALLFLLPASFIVHAQGFSAGIRGGAGYWCRGSETRSYELRALQGSHMSFVPEVFVRYTAKSRWAFESAFNTSALRYSYSSFSYDTPYDTIETNYSVRNLELTLSAQYDLVCPALKRRPVFRHIHSYAGISFGAAKVTTSGDVYFGKAMPFAYDYRPANNDAIHFWTGISHTIIIDVTKRLSLISVCDIQVRPDKILGAGLSVQADQYYNPVAKFGVRLGGSYRF